MNPSPTVRGEYLGDKRIKMTHVASGAEIITDAPVDNHGLGSAFSPTDLCASSLVSCVLTILAIKAESMGIKELPGAHFSLEKRMQADPRRIGAVIAEIHLPSAIDEEKRAVLEATAHACPVHRTLRDDLDTEIAFLYDVS